jgi:4-amino-4-deoxy-L-arabinose transferase-like glycosyltransferase
VVMRLDFLKSRRAFSSDYASVAKDGVRPTIEVLVGDLSSRIPFRTSAALIRSMVAVVCFTVLVLFGFNQLTGNTFPPSESYFTSWVVRLIATVIIVLSTLLYTGTLAVPREFSRSEKWLGVCILIAGVTVLVIGMFVVVPDTSMHKRPLCVFEAMLIGFSFPVLVSWLFRDSYSLHPKKQVVFVVSTAAFIGSLAMDSTCLVSASHSLELHFFPSLLAAVVAGFLVRIGRS